MPARGVRYFPPTTLLEVDRLGIGAIVALLEFSIWRRYLRSRMVRRAPLVTVVTTPRERFSLAPRSLDGILESTEEPFRLVYVDGGSPPSIRRHIAGFAERHGFTVVRTRRYLSPNRARNLGLQRVETKYAAFVDNDVVVSPGWLHALVDCAEATDATVVSPLICQGETLHTVIHCAGGACGIRESPAGERQLFERIADQGRTVAERMPQLERGETGLAEFHCMLVRRDVFDRIGPLDEQLLNTREHVDFCMLVARSGGVIYLEPRSIVTYLHDAPLRVSDLGYYMLRWSDAWERRSLLHLRAKWNLTDEGTLAHRLRSIGRRRRHVLIRPLVDSLPFKAESLPYKLARRGLTIADRGLNRAIAAWHGDASGAWPP